MSARWLRLGAAFVVLFGAGACAREKALQASADETPAASNGGRGERAGEIAVDRAMLSSISVDAVHERDVPRALVLSGKVQFDDDRVARVLTPLSGQVVDLRVKVGDAVAKGGALCAINSREVAAAIGEHAESHKDLDLAEKNAAMTRDLFEHEAASKIALQQAENDLAKARSRVARQDEELRVLGFRTEEEMARATGRIIVPSPLRGVVIERRVTEGQFVQNDSAPLMVVADLSAVWIVGDVFERDLHAVQTGQEATITTSAYPGERFQGRVSYISDVIDPTTRTAKVRVAVPNRAARLKPEMFVSIALAQRDSERVLAVPARAIIQAEGRTWVYVAAGPATFVRRAVDVAQDAGDERRIIAGLRAGERIVVDGALLLRQEEEKRAG